MRKSAISSRCPTLILFVLWVAQARSACAADTGCSDQAWNESEAHFKRGEALFDEDELPAALGEFEAAYNLCPKQKILYNMCVIKKRLLRYVEAISCYEGYRAQNTRMTDKRREEVEQALRGMRAVLVEVQLGVTPEGAAVIIDGQNAGLAPLRPVQLLAGPHVIEASAEGYKSARLEIHVESGTAKALTIALEEIPKTGFARIDSSVSGAAVSINDKPAGFTPLEVELLAGGHALAITAAGHVPFQTELTIIGGERREVKYRLEPITVPPKRPLYKEWWPWTIGGVLLGGGAAALGIGLTWRIDCPQLGSLGSQCANVNR